MSRNRPFKEMNCDPCPLAFADGVQCKTSAFDDDPRRMLKFIRCFREHYTCHIQSEYVLVVRFWKPYRAQSSWRPCAEDDSCSICRNAR
jgi:hypothetical protein